MKNLTTTAAIFVLFGAFFASVTAAPQYTGAKTPAAAARDKQKMERDGTGNRLSPREKQDSIWDCVLDMGPQGVPMCERGLEAGGPED
jgi:hypothetical protein